MRALNALQNSMMFTPCWPSAGPTGGEGFACSRGTLELHLSNDLLCHSGFLSRVRAGASGDALPAVVRGAGAPREAGRQAFSTFV